MHTWRWPPCEADRIPTTHTHTHSTRARPPPGRYPSTTQYRPAPTLMVESSDPVAYLRSPGAKASWRTASLCAGTDLTSSRLVFQYRTCWGTRVGWGTRGNTGGVAAGSRRRDAGAEGAGAARAGAAGRRGKERRRDDTTPTQRGPAGQLSLTWPASSPDTKKLPLWVKAMVRTGVSWLCMMVSNWSWWWGGKDRAGAKGGGDEDCNGRQRRCAGGCAPARPPAPTTPRRHPPGSWYRTTW